MDRQGSLGREVASAVVFALLLSALPSASAADAPAPAPERASAPDAQPIEREPYKIEMHLVADPSARLDDAARKVLIGGWSELVHRFIGASWSVALAEHPSPLVGAGLSRLKAEALAGADPSLDKVWLIWASADPRGAGIVFTGREYDVATRWLGPLQEQKAPSRRDLARSLFAMTRNLFSPSALITGQEGGRALLKVRGSALAPASAMGAVVAQGTTFIPLRLVRMRDESIRITRIAYTYLVAESIEGSTARCAIVSAFRDPLTQRIARPNTLAALGVKAGDSPLHLRFVTRADKTPAAGYTLTERVVPDGAPREVGMTDRAGRIVVEPGSDRALVKLRLLAGSSEPLAEFPIMPGESSEEREISVNPLPLAAKYQSRLDALRDEVVDQVALRGRLERMMQARVDGEEWAGLEGLLKEYAALPAPKTFGDALEKMKDEATKESFATSRSTVLTKNLQAQFSDLQALIDGYLNDEAYGAFSEVLEKKKKDDAEAAKLAARRKAPRSLPAPPQEPPAASPTPAATAPPPSPAVPKAAPAAPKATPKPAPPRNDSGVPF